MDIEGKTIQEGEPTPDYPGEIKNEIDIAGAIEILNILKSKVTLVKVDDENNSEKEYRLPFLMNIEQQAIETVLSELEKKDKEIEQYQNMLATNDMLHVLECEKKDKIIDEMAIYINNFDIDEDICKKVDDPCKNYAGENGKLCNECITKYFTRKVEGK